ncbi:hypothetical protein ACF06X_23980 [Streptomyces sp. NPDC015346]|uniref:hypothetical protein n=1 Tax=Streptomyces sp. NPDC015346 TaxID=3364954 RepID=UPI0036FFB3AE
MATGTARRRGLRLAATLTVVVLALTGFETGKGSSGGSGGKGGSKSGGKSRSSGGGGDSGGGCSSSEKKNDDYGDYDGANSGSTYTASPTPTPTPTASATSTVDVVVVDCVEPARKKRKGRPARKADTTATLRITSRETFTETFEVTVEFEGSAGSKVDSAQKVVTVEPGETKTFEVAMKTPKAVAKVKNCSVDEVRAR